MLLALLPAAPIASTEFIDVRNHNPFAQVYGLPGFADAAVLDRGATSVAGSTVVVNHALVAAVPGEQITLDGETYLTSLALGFGLTDRLTLGVELPFVAYTGGIFDGAIEGWHDLWGFPNGDRDGPDNELRIRYVRDGTMQFELESSGGGVGDVRLDASYQLAGTAREDLAVVLRAGLKLPVGNAQRLRGSEATDVSLDLAIRKELALPRGELVLLADAGVLWLGSGEVLPDLQRGTVGFGAVGALWRLTERWRFNVQLYGQSSYFRSELDELGSDSIQLTVGGSYTWVQRKLRLSVGVVEDPFGDTTPDVALQIQLTKDLD